ncbi:uncharacterized protein LOC132063063 [Lycium ferocissimum]|uniref:uncharacterized protein LOC132063063 n=1 Tax=Lycium ferocissimum TaxID=112874 RepID=UPI002815801C|nr:uncharacterized protein LOC132063063 [Lycium ferocissimum]
MVDFNVIWGISWLSPHYAILYCHSKTVTLAMPGAPTLEWKGNLSPLPKKVISFVRAKKLVEKGCLAYLAHICDTSADTPSIDSVPVVCEFEDVFPADLPVFIDDILVYSSSKEEHEKHLSIVFGLLREEKFLQGHTESECFVLHPELEKDKEERNNKNGDQAQRNKVENKAKEDPKEKAKERRRHSMDYNGWNIVKDGKIQPLVDNEHVKGKSSSVDNSEEIQTSNAFAALEEDVTAEEDVVSIEPQACKSWVEQSFGKQKSPKRIDDKQEVINQTEDIQKKNHVHEESKNDDIERDEIQNNVEELDIVKKKQQIEEDPKELPDIAADPSDKKKDDIEIIINEGVVVTDIHHEQEEGTLANCTGKIWLFAMEEWEVHLVEDHAQHLTVRVVHQQTRQEDLVSVVYASCDASIRRNLWDSMIHLAGQWQIPWLVGGDFNVVLTDEEKLGGLPVLFQETEDFAACINDCHLYDLGYIGSTFTWWNGRSDAATIFKRLDRILSNQKMIDQAPQMTVTHLIKKGSDHAPLELQIRQETERIIKPFKFLNFWIYHATFNLVVIENWTADFAGNPFLIFQHKLKMLRKGLAEWRKVTYGNIFQKVATLEEVIFTHEAQFEADPLMENRAQLHRVQAELSKYLHLEEAYWRQKSGMKWFKDGDRNTRFFHTYVNGRRKKLKLTNIQNGDEEWLTIVDIITKEHNHELVELPSEEEIKSAIFGLSGDSASGPDGFTGCFFQHC